MQLIHAFGQHQVRKNLNNMSIIILLSIILLTLDQISKILVIKLLSFKEPITIIKNFFYLTYIQNKGAAFSILTGERILLILISIIIIIYLINYIKKNKPQTKLDYISISLVIGGALGNLIDRIIRGSVVDFLDFHIFSYNFPVFNLADTFITIGVILLIINLNRKEQKDGNNRK